MEGYDFTGCGKTFAALDLWKGTASSRAVSPLETIAARLEAVPFHKSNADFRVFPQLVQSCRKERDSARAHTSQPLQALASKHRGKLRRPASGAEARQRLSTFDGATEVMPLPNSTIY